ncbi:MAG TPA: hypothetical protein PLP31_02355 [Thermoanaerobaculaceae bacterium]|nr:hypothetical protein [Thermoanaerobaculaceae bacterium]
MIRFGTSGWRGVVGQEFTFRNVRLAMDAVARVLRSHGEHGEVVVAYDTRLLSEKFAQEASAVFTHHGFETVLAERDLPSPCVAAAVRARGASLGVVFTASHNPPEYYGVKLFTRDGTGAGRALSDEIERMAKALSPAHEDFYVPQRHLSHRTSLSAPYLESLQNGIDWDAVRRRGLTICVDPLWGTAREFLDRILIANQVTTHVVHGTKDPYFGGYSPECTPPNLADLRELVRQTKADLGLATDGDGDRFGIIDGACRVVTPNLAIALLMEYLVRRRRLVGGLGRTVATTRLVDRIGHAYGREVVETPVGFFHFGPDLVSGRLGVAAEESAGLGVATHLPERDGLYAALLVVEMVAVEGRSLGELARDLAARHGTLLLRRVRLPLNDRTRAALARLQQGMPDRLGDAQVVRCDCRDGVLLELADCSWVLIRPAATEPRLRIYAEAPTIRRLHSLVREARALVQRAEEGV